jgi:hypothetical protein
MPVAHSVPIYKVIKVATKIGIILFCYHKNYDMKKWQKKLFPVASGFAVSLVAGIPTFDLPGLFVVGVKVFNELTKLPVDAETAPKFLGNFPLVNGESLPIYQPDGAVNITLGSSFADGFIHLVLTTVGGESVAGEIAAAILEEFKFDSFVDFFENLFS